MKVSVRKENLKEGLFVVERAISKSLTLPILGNVLLFVEKNFLELAATDLEIGVRYRILAKTDEEGQVVAPAKALSQFVALLPAASVALDANEKSMEVSSGEYATKIKVLSPDEFPLIPLPKDEKYIELEAKTFCLGVNQVVGMAGTSQSRPEISGVFFSFGENQVRIAATDSFRLGEKVLRLEAPQEERSFILPQRAARELVSIFGEREGQIKTYFSPTQVIFDYIANDPSQSRIQLVSRLIEGEYPRYRDIVPSRYKTRAVVDKNEFINRIKIAGIFSGKTSEVRLEFQPEKKGIAIFSQNTDIGEQHSFLSAEVTGEPMEAAFNWKFLLEGALGVEANSLEMAMSAEDGPAAFLPPAEEGYMYIIMPIRM
ncbi:MAG: DNA polymerase III subunit beta [Candidatus Wildermuthbacteria bacterium]|nr:DNA polymerase III subunit beta [Candidatus Wildermuthbacteria bacterium]